MQLQPKSFLCFAYHVIAPYVYVSKCISLFICREKPFFEDSRPGSNCSIPLNQINTEVITWENHRKHYLLEHIYLIYQKETLHMIFLRYKTKSKLLKLFINPYSFGKFCEYALLFFFFSFFSFNRGRRDLTLECLHEKHQEQEAPIQLHGFWHKIVKE